MGTAVGPSKLERGSILIVRDQEKQKYLAVELGEMKTLNNKRKIWLICHLENKGVVLRKSAVGNCILLYGMMLMRQIESRGVVTSLV